MSTNILTFLYNTDRDWITLPSAPHSIDVYKFCIFLHSFPMKISRY